jgi:hypothetical protein
MTKAYKTNFSFLDEEEKELEHLDASKAYPRNLLSRFAKQFSSTFKVEPSIAIGRKLISLVCIKDYRCSIWFVRHPSTLQHRTQLPL